MQNLPPSQGREHRCALSTPLASRHSPLTTLLRSVAVLACLAVVPVEAVASAGLATVTSPTGPARRWEAGLPVSPFSQVNLRTGRVWTELPIVGWGGKGPAISFSLYHNMAGDWGPPTQCFCFGLGDLNGDGLLSTADMDPFVDVLLSGDPTQSDLAVADFNANQTVDAADLTAMTNALTVQQTDAVWTHSYSTCLEIDAGTVTVIWGDGTKDAYVDDGGGGFTPPPGVFSTLEIADYRGYFGETIFNGYQLTTKTQTRFLFNPSGRLEVIQDAGGTPLVPVANRVRLLYDSNNGRLISVNDATNSGGRLLTLAYNAGGRLSTITAPFQGAGTTRVWTLLYLEEFSGTPQIDGTGPLVAVEDPLAQRINIGYNGSFDIASIADKAGNAYQFAYKSVNGRLLTVTDPASQARQISYLGLAGGGLRSTYTDVRGMQWKFNFDSLGNLTMTTNPLAQAQTLAYADPALIHEPTIRTNALGNAWTMDYDAVGNVTSVADPLGHTWAYGYDEFNANDVTGLNNLSSITPPADNAGNPNTDKRVTIHYDNPNDLNDSLPDTPTSPTQIDAPPAQPGGPISTTAIEYYGLPTDPSSSLGLVKQVTGPNTVVTRFEYDNFGQPGREIENPNPPAGGQSLFTFPSSPPTVTNETTVNDGGVLESTNHPIATGCPPPCDEQDSVCVLDDMGQVIGVRCPAMPCIVNCLPQSLAGETGDPPPYFGPHLSPGCFSGQLSANGLPEMINRCVQDPLSAGPDASRDVAIQYDEFDRPLSITLDTAEPTGGGVQVTRSFTNHYDDVAGTFTAFDQDGNSFTTTTDPAGRIATVSRFIARPGGDPFAFTTITASFTYDAAGRLRRVDHGNGTAVIRQYDAADRPTLIRHEDAGGNAMLELAYEYTPDGLVKRLTETDEVSEGQGLGTGGQTFPPLISQVDFEYDNRNRLTRETREALNNVFDTDLGPAEYDLSYTYDAGGNRLSKTDHRSGVLTTYHYDVTEAGDGGQHNNRLLGYDVSGPIMVGSTGPMLEQTVYTYGPAGNVTRLVKRLDMDGDGLIDANDILAAVWWFYYDTGNRLWLVVRGTGDYDETFATLSNTVLAKAAEYRYDGGRQRYLVRERNPNPDDPELPEDPNTNPRWTLIGTGQWRDYLGNDIYNDYTVNATGTVTNGTGYIPGIGFDDPSLTYSPAYVGSDLIGTTRRVVDSSAGGQGGTGVSPVIHRTILTAFGEPISTAGIGNNPGGTGVSPVTRYGYAGAFGYEAPEASFDPLADIGWLHVGERYYDPAVGRFMQRDPIGIRGGTNLYVYVANEPIATVDPSGLNPRSHEQVRDAGGRFGRKKLRFRKVGPNPYLWAYGWGCLVARAGHALAGKPYEDPHDIIYDIIRLELEAVRLRDPGAVEYGKRVLGQIERTGIGPICFVEETPVRTANGTESIAHISAGKRVCSSPYDMKDSYSTVLRTIAGEADSLVRITLQGEVLSCTEAHPFWTTNRGWIAAGKLTIEDMLLDYRGWMVPIDRVFTECLDSPVPVCNIDVDNDQAYFVGSVGVLVHNKD